jgi:hypothetical protein
MAVPNFEVYALDPTQFGGAEELRLFVSEKKLVIKDATNGVTINTLSWKKIIEVEGCAVSDDPTDMEQFSFQVGSDRYDFECDRWEPIVTTARERIYQVKRKVVWRDLVEPMVQEVFQTLDATDTGTITVAQLLLVSQLGCLRAWLPCLGSLLRCAPELPISYRDLADVALLSPAACPPLGNHALVRWAAPADLQDLQDAFFEQLDDADGLFVGESLDPVGGAPRGRADNVQDAVRAVFQSLTCPVHLPGGDARALQERLLQLNGEGDGAAGQAVCARARPIYWDTFLRAALQPFPADPGLSSRLSDALSGAAFGGRDGDLGLANGGGSAADVSRGLASMGGLGGWAGSVPGATSAGGSFAAFSMDNCCAAWPNSVRLVVAEAGLSVFDGTASVGKVNGKVKGAVGQLLGRWAWPAILHLSADSVPADVDLLHLVVLDEARCAAQQRRQQQRDGRWRRAKRERGQPCAALEQGALEQTRSPGADGGGAGGGGTGGAAEAVALEGGAREGGPGLAGLDCMAFESEHAAAVQKLARQLSQNHFQRQQERADAAEEHRTSARLGLHHPVAQVSVL